MLEREELWENSSEETLLAWTRQTQWGRQREAHWCTQTHILNGIQTKAQSSRSDMQRTCQQQPMLPSQLAQIVGVGAEPGVHLRKRWNLPSPALNFDKLLGSWGGSRLTVLDRRVVTPLELNHLFMGEGVTQDRQKIQIFT